MNDKNIPKDRKQVKLEEVRNMINECLNRLYKKDSELFKKNGGRGISERGIVFRFAHYLQQEIDKKYPGYFVDCDYNSSVYFDENGNKIKKSGKRILVPNIPGAETKRFIDIIVHKRTANASENIICFEIKKWNNSNRKAREKDINNLKQLTSTYNYKYGFYLIFEKSRNNIKCAVFEEGKEIKKGNC
jgi:hypothetical protein